MVIAVKILFRNHTRSLAKDYGGQQIATKLLTTGPENEMK